MQDQLDVKDKQQEKGEKEKRKMSRRKMRRWVGDVYENAK